MEIRLHPLIRTCCRKLKDCQHRERSVAVFLVDYPSDMGLYFFPLKYAALIRFDYSRLQSSTCAACLHCCRVLFLMFDRNPARWLRI